MFTETVSPEFAAQLEACEVNAWVDMYAAAPADFARQFQLEIIRVRNIVLTRCKTIPFIHFNCVKNLGMTEPATEALVDEVLAIYHAAGVRSFTFYHIPHCQPPNLPDWFKSRNLQRRGGWERIYRNSSMPTSMVIEPRDGFGVEKVTRATAPQWAAYIDAVYGLPTTPWLLALVERPGWHHYLLRQKGEIVAVRTLYIDGAGMGWLGIDAPVPGLMAPSYDLDIQICRAIVKDGIDLGVRYFVADIEAPTSAMNTPAYHHFEALGFKRPYFRNHYSY
jgi:hypothetical protein